MTVIGDGAVGLCAVLAAKRLGAERILLAGRHKDRTDLGREFGATDVIAERGDEGIELVREFTGGDGTHTVLECVGTRQAIEMAIGVARDGGVIGRVGAAQYTEVRPHRRPGRGAGRLPRDGQPRGAEGAYPSVNLTNDIARIHEGDTDGQLNQ